jgi:AP endonuclease 1
MPNAEVKQQEEEREGEGDTPSQPEPSSKAAKKTRKRKRAAANAAEGESSQGQIDGAQIQAEAESGNAALDAQAAPKKKKRRTKAEIAADMLPIAPRTAGSKIRVGAHVSDAGGVQNAVLNAVQIGCNAMALFLKSQRKWENPPLKEGQCQHFLSYCAEHKYNGDSEGGTGEKSNV